MVENRGGEHGGTELWGWLALVPTEWVTQSPHLELASPSDMEWLGMKMRPNFDIETILRFFNNLLLYFSLEGPMYIVKGLETKFL